jgi:hypothetical protein
LALWADSSQGIEHRKELSAAGHNKESMDFRAFLQRDGRAQRQKSPAAEGASPAIQKQQCRESGIRFPALSLKLIFYL